MSNSANCFVFLLKVFRIMTFGGTPLSENNSENHYQLVL